MKHIPQPTTTRRTGQTTVGTTAVPVTKVGDDSSSGTTFTTTTAVDGAAWDLSAIIVGDIALTDDECAGIITAVDDGNDTVTIGDGWYCDATGWQKNLQVVANVPADGSVVTIYRISHAKRLRLKAAASNTSPVFWGKHGNAVVTDYGLHPGKAVDLVPDEPDNYLDLTQVYAIVAAGSVTIEFIPIRGD